MTTVPLVSLDNKGHSPMGSYVQAYLYYKAGLSPRTLEQYKELLGNLIWWLENLSGSPHVALCDVKPMHLMQFYEYLRTYHPDGRWATGRPNTRRPASKKTVKLHEITFKAFFQWAVDRRYIKHSPFANGDVPPQPAPEPHVEPLTNEEIAALLAQCGPNTRNGARNNALLRLLFSTGLRITEALGIRYNPLNADASDFHIVVQHGEMQGEIFVRGKGDKPRYVFVRGDTLTAIFDYLAAPTRPQINTGYLFLTEAGGQLNRNSIAHVLTRLAAKAGVSEARAHRIRHSYATGALRKGISEQALIRLLGHASEKMLRIYVNLSKVDLAKMARDFDPAADLPTVRPKRKR